VHWDYLLLKKLLKVRRRDGWMDVHTVTFFWWSSVEIIYEPETRRGSFRRGQLMAVGLEVDSGRL